MRLLLKYKPQWGINVLNQIIKLLLELVDAGSGVEHGCIKSCWRCKNSLNEIGADGCSVIKPPPT